MSSRFEDRSNHVVGILLLALGLSILSERSGGPTFASPFLFAIGVSLAYVGLVSSARRLRLFSGLVLVFGLLLTTNGIGLTRIAFGSIWSILWPLLLILLGALLIGSWAGGGPSGGKRIVNVIGDYRLTASETDALTSRSVWSLIGDVKIDLSALRIAEGVTDLSVTSLIGDTVLIVPSGVAVEVVSSTLLGDTDLFNQRYDGVMHTARYRTDSFNSYPSRLRVYIQSVIGDVNVRRVG